MNKNIVIVAGEPYSVFLEILFKSIKLKKIKKPFILICSKKLLISQMKKLNYNIKINSINKYKIKDIKQKVKNAYFPEHLASQSLKNPLLTIAIGKKLNSAISIDNGVMHMMGLANIPMIVLFGPTKPEKFAPNQKNITVLDSKKLYGSSDISKIKIKDLLKYIN